MPQPQGKDKNTTKYLHTPQPIKVKSTTIWVRAEPHTMIDIHAMQIDKPSIASSIQKAQCKAWSKIGIIYTNSCVLKTYKYKQQSKEGVNMDL